MTGIITSRSAKYNTNSSFLTHFSEIAKSANSNKRIPVFTFMQVIGISAQLCAESGYKRGSFEKVIRALIKLADKNHQVFHSQKSIAFEAGCSVDSVGRALKQFVIDGHIINTRRGKWLDRHTNEISLMFLKSKLPDVNRKMRNDLRTLNLTDQDTYYNELQVSTFEEKKKAKKPKKPKPPPKTETKFVDAVALAENPDQEITRVCKAYALSEQDCAYALKRMREPGIPNPPGFLSSMAKRLSIGLWKTNDLKEPIITSTMSKEEEKKQLNNLFIEAEELATNVYATQDDVTQAQQTGELYGLRTSIYQCLLERWKLNKDVKFN